MKKLTLIMLNLVFVSLIAYFSLTAVKQAEEIKQLKYDARYKMTTSLRFDDSDRNDMLHYDIAFLDKDTGEVILQHMEWNIKNWIRPEVYTTSQNKRNHEILGEQQIPWN